MREAADRLREARERAGFSTASKAAERFHWITSTYLAHENGSRGLRADAAARYAKAFKVSSSWLLYGEGNPEAAEIATITRRVPVVGEVRAGAWREVVNTDEPEYYVPVHLPEYDRADLFAVRVSGNSMDRHFKDGTTLIACPAAQSGIREGAFVIVQRTRNGLIETTVKEVSRGKDGTVELWPRSNDPQHQTPIVIVPNRDSDDGVAIIGLVVSAITIIEPPRGPLLDI